MWNKDTGRALDVLQNVRFIPTSVLTGHITGLACLSVRPSVAHGLLNRKLKNAEKLREVRVTGVSIFSSKVQRSK